MIKFIIENYSIGGVLYETIETEKANIRMPVRIVYAFWRGGNCCSATK